MRILILGANGMIGHKLYQELSKKYTDTWSLVRMSFNEIKEINIFNTNKLIYNFDIRNFVDVETVLNKIDPDVIINSIGLTIRRGVFDSIFNSTLINSSFPHLLNEWVNSKDKKKLIHLSTDCVFSGAIGNYLDESIPDATDYYGRTKALGEIFGPNTLTIRSSMIGLEIFNHTELLDWVLSKKGSTISGYTNVQYSGITTIRLAKIISFIIEHNIEINGIYNVSSEGISKYELLNLINKTFMLDIEILKNENYVSNKILISEKFFNLLGMKIPNWNDLVIELYNDALSNSNIYNL